MPQGFFKPQAGLPHKPIPLAIHLIVEAALRESWRRLRQHPPAGFDIETAHEDTVTLELLKVLHGEVFNSEDVDGFTSEFFMPPVREPKVENFDGTLPDKMPDLLVGLVGRPKARVPWQDWLFVECKPIRKGRAAGGHYCDRGIKRFVQGNYAWAMTSALMVGYASDGYNLSPKLEEALSTRRRTIPTLLNPKPCRCSQASAISERTHFSEHRRTFKYIQTGTPAPSITIRHLWLKRDTTLL